MERYRARLSGPLLDRIDLHVKVPAVPWKDLASPPSAVTSATMRERVLAARAVQEQRYAGMPYCRSNADLAGSLFEEHCALGRNERAFMEQSVKSLALSARGLCSRPAPGAHCRRFGRRRTHPDRTSRRIRELPRTGSGTAVIFIPPLATGWFCSL